MLIIKHGGKQYWAESGSVLQLEKIEGNIGDCVKLDVIASGSGSIDLSAKSVDAKIIKHFRDDKVIVFKKKKRHHYERKKGHKQHLTQVRVA